MPFLVWQRNSYLNNFEEVHITPHSLIVIIWRCSECPYWTCHYAWKLRILQRYYEVEAIQLLAETKCQTHHRNIWIFLDSFSYTSHLLFQIRSPNVSYSRHGCFWHHVMDESNNDLDGFSLRSTTIGRCDKDQYGPILVSTCDTVRPMDFHLSRHYLSPSLGVPSAHEIRFYFISSLTFVGGFYSH